MEELIKYMKALVVLQLRAMYTRDEGGEPPKPELLLSQAGFLAREIAELTGKSQTAVAKTISRAKIALSKEEAPHE
jgi:hypothetical protein